LRGSAPRFEAKSEYEKAVYSKGESQAARLALIFACIRRVESGLNCFGDWELSDKDMEDGIAVARWFMQEHLRIDAEIHGTIEQDELEDHLAWMVERNKGQATARDLQTFRGIKTSSEAQQILYDLKRAGKGWFDHRPPGPRGGPATSVFVCGAKPGGEPA
jgi:hypothetical protein